MIPFLFAVFAAPPGPARLEVEAVDARGEPVGMAWVRVVEEDVQHRVNVVTGRWQGEHLYDRGGEERPLRRGDRVRVEVGAVDHAIARHSVFLERRTNRLRVVLLPSGRPLPESRQGERAAPVYERWVEAEQAYRADPTDERRAQEETLRRRAREAVREWYDAVPTDAVRDLCLQVGSHATCAPDRAQRG